MCATFLRHPSRTHQITTRHPLDRHAPPSPSLHALCATPPALANAPLASLPSPPTCSEEQLDSQMDNLDSQMDTPRADYYEYYYSEPGSDQTIPYRVHNGVVLVAGVL